MVPRSIAGVLSLCLLGTTSAAADVTIRQKTSGKGAGAMMAGETTQYIKAFRMRVDQAMGGAETSTIVDVASQQMTVLSHKQREAEVFDMSKIGAEVAKIAVSEPKVSVTPTSQTRQIANATCTVHDVQVAVPVDMAGEKMTIGFTGPACIVKDAPGQADYTGFYKTAIDKGLFFGDPRAAKAQPGQARGMAALYLATAALGMPYAQEMNMKFEGTGTMAAMMAKMGGTTITTEVVSVDTNPIPDSTFEVPASYKVVKR